MATDISAILSIFEQLASIPRCSKHEKEISEWLIHWAHDHHLDAESDRAGNVIIRVPASPGHEHEQTIVLQGHMDMVCEKTMQSQHDFSRDPIVPKIEGDWLMAEGTTLGADNGIAMATCLALAEDKACKHPPLELLFTVDEETGLTGAKSLQPDFVSGRILINLDSEHEGVLIIGCAGGKTTHITLPLEFAPLPPDFERGIILVTGLLGGHSGVHIDQPRASANKILARALYLLSQHIDVRLIDVKGGSAHNAIARHAEAEIAYPTDAHELLARTLSDFEHTVRHEYEEMEKSISIQLMDGQSGNIPIPGMNKAETQQCIDLLMALPHGVFKRSAKIEQLVETSNNLALIELKDRILHIVTSQRSSEPSGLDEVTARIEAVVRLANGSVFHTDGYPAWQPEMDSPLLKLSIEVYQNIFQKTPQVDVIHAGLECGIMGAVYKGMDMISIGPTIEDPHSPNERLYLPSLEKLWIYLLALLKSFTSEQA
jgi:dipeptidase D